ncbi:MAG TPA: DUF503 domain-containing protein [Gemmatimonadales bacterium]|nr:DUF503 domain-containing protein [Gemmatimonadales bacterium]
MVIGVRSWELHLPGVHSLKEKRAVLSSLKSRLHKQFNLSVAETAHQDVWQRSELSAAVVAADRRQADSILEAADRMVELNPSVRIIDTSAGYR